MESSLWQLLLIVPFLEQTFALPQAPAPGASSAAMDAILGTLGSVTSLVTSRDTDNSFDPTELSSITKLAAIGDSYSAGIGAGKRLGTVLDSLFTKGDWACSRYDNAYPYLVNGDPRLGDPSKRTFQFLSCSGAVASDVIKKQIPSLTSDQQAIMLSIGGNDLELVDIINQCVYQFAVLNPLQVAVAQAAALTKEFGWAKDYDWSRLGRGCDGQLDRSKSLISSSTFSSSIDSVLSAAKLKLAPGGKIYYTGYSKFFAGGLTADCNTVTWTTWFFKAHDIFREPEYLTQARRKAMNDLVDAANQQLAAAAKRAGDAVVFVDYDKYVSEFAGGYCLAGVNEATTESNSRSGLMFYELNTWDPAGATPFKRSSGGELNGTFYGELDIFAQIATMMDPGAEFTEPAAKNASDPSDPAPVAATGIVASDAASATAVGGGKFFEVGGLVGDAISLQVPNILPDGYGRVFHPTILLHNIVANLVVYEMGNQNSITNGFNEVPEDLNISVCHYSPPSTIAPPAAPTSAAPAPPKYASGTCSFHLHETNSCEPDTFNYHGDLILKDNAGTQIGQTPTAGAWMTGARPMSLGSALPYTLEVVAINNGNDVQFRYSDFSFKSTDKNENGNRGWCMPTVGGWTKDIGCKNAEPLMTRRGRDMDCSFHC